MLAKIITPYDGFHGTTLDDQHMKGGQDAYNCEKYNDPSTEIVRVVDNRNTEPNSVFDNSISSAENNVVKMFDRASKNMKVPNSVYYIFLCQYNSDQILKLSSHV